MTTKYVAVGFRVDTARSIFYFKMADLTDFIAKLERMIEIHEPDFVSLRMVKSDE